MISGIHLVLRNGARPLATLACLLQAMQAPFVQLLRLIGHLHVRTADATLLLNESSRQDKHFLLVWHLRFLFSDRSVRWQQCDATTGTGHGAVNFQFKLVLSSEQVPWRLILNVVATHSPTLPVLSTRAHTAGQQHLNTCMLGYYSSNNVMHGLPETSS